MKSGMDGMIKRGGKKVYVGTARGESSGFGHWLILGEDKLKLELRTWFDVGPG